ncbi:MAG: Mu-like prophage major head subunit gpT family protein, partial [Porticoccaceae bacterium]|nr:Mu-like prophage major head subunit gpT family protein [Porticoccaceae bacterium]
LESAVTTIRAAAPVDDAPEGYAESVASMYAAAKDSITAIEQRLATQVTAEDKQPRVTPHSLAEYLKVPDGMDRMAEAAIPLALVEGASSGGPYRFKMFMIGSGRSGNGVDYSNEVLREAAPLFENKPIYVDHPVKKDDGSWGARSLTTKAGFWENVHYAENVQTPKGIRNGLVGEVVIFKNGPQSWLGPFIAEAIESGHPEQVGISIFAAGPTVLRRDAGGQIYKEAKAIVVAASADAVAEPGAGGYPLNLAAALGVDADVDALKDLSVDTLKELRPDLFAQIMAEAAAASADPKTEDDPPKVDPTTTQPSAEMAAFAEAAKEMQRMVFATKLDQRLSPLVEAVQTAIREEIGDEIVDDTRLGAIIERNKKLYETVLAEAVPQGGGGGFTVPFGSVRMGADPLKQIVAALDDFFEGPVDEDMVGKFQPIRSISQFYVGVTGDQNFTGYYNKKLSWIGEHLEQPWENFAEAIPTAPNIIGGGTLTFANLLSTSATKALFNFYQEQEKWWMPIVKRGRVNNLKQQDRIRLHNFGTLTPRTVGGQEYTELTWGETAEELQPTEVGNTVPVSRWAIINDDLDGISSLPRLMAQSATLTLNEALSSLFTANGGTGPALVSDSENIFDAVEHQGNLLDEELSRNSLKAARTIIQKMNNDAGKRIGLNAKHLLVPIDLEDRGWELISTERDPDTANNARNILNDPRRGITSLIVVPNWTNERNWYVMADPSQITGIELDFLFGKEEPDFFVQDQPGTGAVFNNDVITFKVRHNWTTGWLDYRAAVGSVVGD